MKDIRRSRHCRRIFFRYLRQRDKEKETAIATASPIDTQKKESEVLPKSKSSIWRIIGILCLLAIIIVPIAISCYNKNEKEKRLCAVDKCTYYKIENSQYCYRHTCSMSGCYAYKYDRDNYCYAHSTTPLTEIIVYDQTTELNDKYSIITHCYYRAKFKNASENQFFYAVLTIYNSDNKAIYRNYEYLQKRKYDVPHASIYVPLYYHNHCDHYEWTVLRKAPTKINAD